MDFVVEEILFVSGVLLDREWWLNRGVHFFVLVAVIGVLTVGFCPGGAVGEGWGDGTIGMYGDGYAFGCCGEGSAECACVGGYGCTRVDFTGAGAGVKLEGGVAECFGVGLVIARDGDGVILFSSPYVLDVFKRDDESFGIGDGIANSRECAPFFWWFSCFRADGNGEAATEDSELEGISFDSAVFTKALGGAILKFGDICCFGFYAVIDGFIGMAVIIGSYYWMGYCSVGI